MDGVYWSSRMEGRVSTALHESAMRSMVGSVYQFTKCDLEDHRLGFPGRFAVLLYFFRI